MRSREATAGASLLDFDDFFETFARRVAAIIAVSTGDAALAEDATQEAMARAYVRWSRVSKLDRPDLWVIRVASLADGSGPIRCAASRTRQTRRARTHIWKER